jgi:phosphonate transport system substrate-binding protein
MRTQTYSRRSILRGALLAAGAGASLPLLAACGSDGESGGMPEKLVIAVQPTNTPEKLTTDAKEIEKFLSDRVKTKVELVFPTSFGGVIESLNFGHSHAAFMSAWPAALARKKAGADVVLAEVREVVIGDRKSEEPFYYSYWVVKKDSPITSMEQLRGKKVSMPSQLSTSGYVAPMARLIELGYLPADGKEADPKKFFGEVLYSGGYAQSWEALKAGQVDATVIAGDVAETLYRDVLSNTRVIETQGPIPSHGVVFAKQLVDPARAQLKAALLELGQAENRDLMRKFISGIFISFKSTTSDEHLGALTKYLEATGAVFTEKLQ